MISLINQVKSFPCLNVQGKSYNRTVSFAGGQDSFCSSRLDRFINGEIPSEYISSNSGTNGNVSIVRVPGENPLVIKSSHNTPINPRTGLVQRMGVKFDKEAGFLKQIPPTVKNSTRFIGSKSVNGVNYLAMSFVDGKNPYATDAPQVTQKHIETCLADLFELDRAGILHRDLIPENILVTEDSKLNITDYGAAVSFEEMSKKQGKTKFAHPKNLLYSNIKAFEELFMIPYGWHLADSQKEKQAEKLFVGFLRQKGNFHKRKADLLNVEISKFKDGKPVTGLPEGVDLKKLEKLKKTEELQARIFARINTHNSSDEFTKDVRDLEITRINIGTAHKIARLYNAEGVVKNPQTSQYWYGWGCANARALKDKSNSLREKYKNDPDMLRFLKFEKKYGDFYLKKVLIPMYDKVTKQYRDTLVTDGEKQSAVIEHILSEGIRSPMFNQVEGTKTQNNVQKTLIYAPQKRGMFG